MTRALLLLLVVGAASSAHAEVCTETTRPDGPLQAGLLRGDLGVARRACPRTEIAVGAGGRAIVEPENFYGNIIVHGRVDGSWRALPRLELFGALEAVQYQTVISSFTASRIGLGHLSGGATWLLYEDDRVGISAFGRTTLPTAIGLYRNMFPFGFDAGVTSAFSPIEPITLHAAAFGLASIAAGPGDPLPRAGIAAHLGMDIAPWDFIALTAEIDGQSLFEEPLDHLSIGGGLRFAIWSGLGAELGVLVPVAGRERSMGSLIARVGWTF